MALSEAKVRDAVSRYFKATQSGDADIWFARFADSAVVEDPIGTPTKANPAEIRKQGKDFLSAFDEIGLYEKFTHVADNRAVSYWEGRGKTGGQEATFPGIDVFEFDDNGKIIRLEGWWTPPGDHE